MNKDPELKCKISRQSDIDLMDLSSFSETLTSDESEIVEIPTETTPLSPTILDESIDVSLRVLRLAAKGEWALVENILRSADRNKLDLNFRDDLTQLTSLLFAVKDNRVLAADRMLQLGAAVDAQTKDGLGVAHVAAINGTADMVNTLGRHGIPFNEPGGPSSGYPIHLASARIGPDAHPLFLAILSRTVVDRGKDPRFLEDAGGAIPFIYAAEMGNPMIIKELLSVNMDSQVKWRRLVMSMTETRVKFVNHAIRNWCHYYSVRYGQVVKPKEIDKSGALIYLVSDH